MTPMVRGMLDAKTVTGLIERGDVDTILVVFPDQQGRFMGKRVTGDFFVHDVLDGEGAIHACNYLLAVDMEMEPLPGYAYANWDTGYGDLKAIPDLTTMRVVPWLDKTAQVICDVFDEETGVPVEFSKGEFGRGQHEINLRYTDALQMADRHTVYKNGVKEIAALNGRAVTFMAKWSMAEAGSSCHLHSSLWDTEGNKSLMWADDGEHHFSPLFRNYLGGLMSTA